MRRTWLLVVLLTMLFMYQADAAIVNVATPSIRADLHASGAALELVIGGYLLASAAFLISGARLGNLLGYRRVFLIGVALFGTASLACGLAGNASVLVAARVLQGIGGALAFPQVLTAIQLHFEGAARVRALSWYSIALAGGAVSGQIAGGVLVSADVFGLGWRSVFLVNIPVAAAVILAGLRVLPRVVHGGGTKRLDVPGAAVLSVAVLLVLLPLTLGREAGWPAWTWECLAASVPTLWAFVVIERRQAALGRAPVVNLHVIRRPHIAWLLLSQSLLTATYYALLFTIALYLQAGLGHTALFSGLVLLPWVSAFAIPGRIIGHLPAPVKRRLPVIGGVILAIAYTGMGLLALDPNPPAPLLLALLAVGGFGLGAGFSGVLTQVTAAVTARYAADISGVFSTCAQIAGAVGVAALGTVYLSQAGHHAFAVTAAACAVVCAVAAVAASVGIRSGGQAPDSGSPDGRHQETPRWSPAHHPGAVKNAATRSATVGRRV